LETVSKLTKENTLNVSCEEIKGSQVQCLIKPRLFDYKMAGAYGE